MSKLFYTSILYKPFVNRRHLVNRIESWRQTTKSNLFNPTVQKIPSNISEFLLESKIRRLSFEALRCSFSFWMHTCNSQEAGVSFYAVRQTLSWRADWQRGRGLADFRLATFMHAKRRDDVLLKNIETAWARGHRHTHTHTCALSYLACSELNAGHADLVGRINLVFSHRRYYYIAPPPIRVDATKMFVRKNRVMIVEIKYKEKSQT